MSHNSFGHLFRVTTWGESHGPAIGCVVDGCPPRLALSEADIQAMVREAEANADSDRAKREQIETRNGLEATVHSVEKNLKEHGDKLPPADKGDAESALAAAKASLEGTDTEAMKAASERLTQAAMKIGEAVYKAQAEAPAAGPEAAGAASGKPGDKVVDAEFEEVDDHKKSA